MNVGAGVSISVGNGVGRKTPGVGARVLFVPESMVGASVRSVGKGVGRMTSAVGTRVVFFPAEMLVKSVNRIVVCMADFIVVARFRGVSVLISDVNVRAMDQRRIVMVAVGFVCFRVRREWMIDNRYIIKLICWMI